MAEEPRAKWAMRLAEIVLKSHLEDEKHRILMTLSAAKIPSIDQLYWKIAKGELGEDKPAENTQREEPSIRATALLQLAARGNAKVKPIAQSQLLEATDPDKAAYELCLAFLGDTQYIKPGQFKIRSFVLGFAAIRAIERSNDPAAWDLLFSAGLEYPYPAISDECIQAAQRLTGQTWFKEGERRSRGSYQDEAREWWAKNREDFLKTHGHSKP